MTKKHQIIILVVIAILAVGGYLYTHHRATSPAPQQTAQKGFSYEKETAIVSMHIQYPYFDEKLPGAVQANKQMKKELDASIADFEKEAQETAQAPTDLPPSVKSTAQGSGSIEYETDRYVSLFWGSEWYMRGAAHPYHTILTYILDKKSGELVELQDLFKKDSNYLQFLSQYSKEDLIQQSKEGDLGLTINDRMLASGTEPTYENFHHVLPIKDGLMFYFDEYQVAPYAAGPQQVAIPYAKLKDYINPTGVLGMYLK